MAVVATIIEVDGLQYLVSEDWRDYILNRASLDEIVHLSPAGAHGVGHLPVRKVRPALRKALGLES